MNLYINEKTFLTIMSKNKCRMEEWSQKNHPFVNHKINNEFWQKKQTKTKYPLIDNKTPGKYLMKNRIFAKYHTTKYSLN